MKTLAQLTYRHDFRTLPGAFYRDVAPRGLDNPELVIHSAALCDQLALDAHSLHHADSLNLLSGNTVLSQWRPLAMKYTGHQFGYYNPDLGDGRGLLLAETELANGRLLDFHLKGAGLTPFSRMGDGRAVLRSSIREFLASEALAALGVPTTRALCVVGSDTPVQRETRERGATLLRCSDTHIRFGHFEFAYHTRQPELLEALADYVIQRYFPCLAGSPLRYADLFRLIAERTAKLICHWQVLGFNHGVMNTDNMSILGETFDFGPFGFLDAFNPQHVCNHSDTGGRYAFDQQPAIAHWNLSVLAQAMSPLVEREALHEGLQAFNQVFNTDFIAGMRAKLGWTTPRTGDESLIMATLQLLAKNRLDYTLFFRELADFSTERTRTRWRDDCLDPAGFDTWWQDYAGRRDADGNDDVTRRTAMRAVNPRYVLRNYLAQEAIVAAEQGDYAPVRALHEVLTRPFEEQPGKEHYAKRPPDWAHTLEVSCSS